MKTVGITLVGFVLLVILMSPLIAIGLLLGPNYFVGTVIVLTVLGLLIMVSWTVGDIARNMIRDRKDAKR